MVEPNEAFTASSSGDFPFKCSTASRWVRSVARPSVNQVICSAPVTLVSHHTLQESIDQVGLQARLAKQEDRSVH